MLYEIPPTIVLIEDDPGHARLIERNLRRVPVTFAIVLLTDGQAALDYFFPPGQAGHPHPTPRLILLDVNLPGLNGIQVLARLKGDARTRHIPVIMLTSSDDPELIETCYALGCNVYLTKPVEYAHFVDALRHLGLLLTSMKVPTGRLTRHLPPEEPLC
jgi:CheY-like chemotaxis protein